jgi:hypothetical protein
MGRQVDENQREKEGRKAGDKRYKHDLILSACLRGALGCVPQPETSATLFAALSRAAGERLQQ